MKYCVKFTQTKKKTGLVEIDAENEEHAKKLIQLGGPEIGNIITSSIDEYETTETEDF